MLDKELGISKIGHRTRILNKLKSDFNCILTKKNETPLITTGNKQGNNDCNCIIY